jgi:hypothetical protein
MKVTARGWNRNMGENELASIDITELRLSRDQNRRLSFSSPALFDSGLEVHWGQELHFTGNYRMELHLTSLDIMKLFKANFGTELSLSLIERHGFTVSDEPKKAILKTVKLKDVTLGQLVEMTEGEADSDPATEERTEEPEASRPFLRTV